MYIFSDSLGEQYVEFPEVAQLQEYDPREFRQSLFGRQTSSLRPSGFFSHSLISINKMHIN